jgi:hypothetical protein
MAESLFLDFSFSNLLPFGTITVSKSDSFSIVELRTICCRQFGLPMRVCQRIKTAHD